MADTLQTVHWSLGADGHRVGELWLPPGRESPDEVLRGSIRRLNLEERMRSAFLITDPLWYGLWIDSPLTTSQCSLLSDVLAEAARSVPRYRKHIEEFTRALADSVGTGEPLFVELRPPGHVDLGWITTFVHCPRCKAEGPVERWQDSFPEGSIECPVCGHSYSPDATYSAEPEPFAETVRCPSCRAEQRVGDYSDAEIRSLEDRHTFDSLSDERTWLRRVADFYRRHPDLEGRIKPHLLQILESDDPEVREAMFDGIPFDEIESPSAGPPLLGDSQAWSEDDREVIEYLQHHHFSLPERIRFVEESIERLGSQLFRSAPVKCRSCGGDLT